MQIMLKFVKSSVAVAALVGVGMVSPAMAQSASEVAVRMQQLEEQVRQLTGQVEELSFQVKQLRAQGAAVPQQSGAAEPAKPAASVAVAAPQPAPPAAPMPQPTQQKRLAAAGINRRQSDARTGLRLQRFYGAVSSVRHLRQQKGCTAKRRASGNLRNDRSH